MRTSQITTVFEGVPSVFLSLPIVPWVARPAFLPVTLTNTDHKYSDTGHPLPDFYLRNTCKFVLQAAGEIPVLIP